MPVNWALRKLQDEQKLHHKKVLEDALPIIVVFPEIGILLMKSIAKNFSNYMNKRA